MTKIYCVNMVYIETEAEWRGIWTDQYHHQQLFFYIDRENMPTSYFCVKGMSLHLYFTSASAAKISEHYYTITQIRLLHNLLKNLFQVFKFTASKLGLMDLNIYDYKLVFGTDVNLKLDKAQRLIYGDSEMTHAMVITAIHEEVRLKGNIINSRL